MRLLQAVVALALSLPLSARAEVPQRLTLNLQLFEENDPSGISYPAGDIEVKLFDAAEGGAALWSEKHKNISIDYGFMSLPLGSVNTVSPLALVLMESGGGPLFLEVTLGYTGEKLPGRIELTSVPFALACSQADNALHLDGKGAAEFALAGHQHLMSQITDWPGSFPAAPHQHDWSDLGSGVPESFPPTPHGHSWVAVSDKPDWLADGGVSWAEVGDKPQEFPSEAHQHGWIDLLGIPGVLEDGLVSWSELVDKPALYPPASHNHAGIYLPESGKAADADKLDGLDGSAYAQVADACLVPECGIVFAKQDETFSKAEVDTAIAEALGPLQTLLEQQQAKLWCLENCDAAKLGDCQQRSCDGAGQTCTASGPAADGTACGTGWGRCAGGQCTDPLVCGQTVCPILAGYSASCNNKQHCEYANADSSGWKKWDIWIWIPAGSFQMGSPEGEPGRGADEGPVHSVTFAKGYYMGKYEVVVAQYEACMAANPGKCTAPSTADFSGPQGLNTTANGRSEHPQNGLTWQQAKDFCAWVAPGGRLPSEAEWENAAKGPVHQKFPWGSSPEPTCSNSTAVFNEAGGEGGYGCSQGGTWKVGSKSAGISWSGALDMSGNVWEWNEDWYHSSYSGAPADGSAWVAPTGTIRVQRGGSFSGAADRMRAARRGNDTPGSRHAAVGARCWKP